MSISKHTRRQLLIEQNDRCALCGCQFSSSVQSVYDKGHAMVCRVCNLYLSCFRATSERVGPNILAATVDYLDKHKGRPA